MKKVKKKKRKKDSRAIPHPILMACISAATIFLCAGVFAAIRMTDDPKPKAIVYRVKNVDDGSISVKHEFGDQDFHYEVGDFFIEPDTTGYPNGFTAYGHRKYVVIAKKYQ